jgi:predicted type IV restriction endonuclease
MRDKGSPLMAVEAKALHEELTERDAAQVVQYCVVEGIEWAALTNGRELRLYNMSLEPGLSAKLVLQQDLLAFNSDEECDALIEQLWLLSRESLTTPTGAKSWLAQQRMDRALRNSVFNVASSAIKGVRRDLLASSGIKARPEEIVQWFRAHLDIANAILPFQPGVANSESALTRRGPRKSAG